MTRQDWGDHALQGMPCNRHRCFTKKSSSFLVTETFPQCECDNNNDGGKPSEQFPIVPSAPWRCSALFNGHSRALSIESLCAAGLPNATGCIEGARHRVDADRHARPSAPAQ
jgi:hypothetical protein